MDAKNLHKFRKLLLGEKQRIINNSENSIKFDLNISADDLPDETDLAASEVAQNLVFKLRERERTTLTRIEAALSRIEMGCFGECKSCEEPIESRRLEVRPFSTFCVSCQERQEHREKIYA